MWIRSASWDGFWILSGLPLGVALTGLGYMVPYPMIVLALVVALSTGHFLAPIALAWTSDYRRIMVSRPIRFIWVPLGIAGIGIGAGVAGSEIASSVHVAPDIFVLVKQAWGNWVNPLALLAVVYGLWNAWHFGMQAFGVMSIYRTKWGGYSEGQRRIDMVYCCGVIWLGILVPSIFGLFRCMQTEVSPGVIWSPGGCWFYFPHWLFDAVRYGSAALALGAAAWMLLRERCLPRIIFILTNALAIGLTFFLGGLWGFAIISVNHWLVAIGLASHVDGNGHHVSPLWFALALAVTGTIVYCLMFVNAGLLNFTAIAVGARLSLGFVHFLYDRWVWKFSDPQVRATIGRDLLPQVPTEARLGHSKPLAHGA